MVSSSRIVTGSCLLVFDLGTIGGAAAATEKRLAVVPTADDQCASGSSSCVKATIQKMQRRFEPLARACSHPGDLLPGLPAHSAGVRPGRR